MDELLESQLKYAIYQGFNTGIARGNREGYQKGFDSARGQLLMKFGQWLGGDFYDWETPIWIAHVAVEDFKCGCCLDVTYDRGLEPDFCAKWLGATHEQKFELFQNVYGYSYQVWRARQEQEIKRREAALEARMNDRLKRAEEVDRRRLENVPPELLP